MRTGTEHHCIFSFDSTVFVVAVLGLLRHFQLRVRQLIIVLSQSGQHLRCATYNPYWLTAPFGRHFFTRLEFADIHFYRRTCCFSTLTGQHAAYKRHRDSSNTYSPCCSCGFNQKVAFLQIHLRWLAKRQTVVVNFVF
eukprot:Amastigsp_a690197_2.p2 type:complete len:138 gc:universal Amastigsp_a690197_2:467-54(-)